jgi:hypothetical protein
MTANRFGILVIGGELCRARRLQASQNVFSTVAAQTRNEIDAGGTDAIAVAELDVLANRATYTLTCRDAAGIKFSSFAAGV